jgi:hypothetical protein
MPHCFKRVLEDVKKQLLQLSIFYRDEWGLVFNYVSDRSATLLELAAQKLQSLGYRLTQVDGSSLVLRCARNAAEACYEVVNSIDFPNDYFGKVIPEVDIREPFWEKLGKGSNSNEWILDLMGDTRCKRPERGKSLGAILFSLEFLEPAEIAENNKGAVRGAVFGLEWCG